MSRLPHVSRAYRARGHQGHMYKFKKTKTKKTKLNRAYFLNGDNVEGKYSEWRAKDLIGLTGRPKRV